MIGEYRHIIAVIALIVGMVQGVGAAQYPVVVTGKRLEFPVDHGAHPQYRTEWWYLTGWLKTRSGKEFGMQITFFRHRSGLQENNPSRFAPTQLIFAHAAIADPARGKLLHDQRSARAGFGLAFAKEGDTDVALDRWRLRRDEGRYLASIAAGEFTMDLAFHPTQAPLPQGVEGFSRKGPRPEQASYYYSLPHLMVNGSVTLEGVRHEASGRAWLDHEWSTEILSKDAVGWDWAGLNLDDGGALMIFRLRDTQGNTHWAGGSYRAPDGHVRALRAQSIAFVPLRRWRSPRTGVDYPVAMRVTAEEFDVELQPLFDDQELDARTSTGTLYWEGAVRVTRSGSPVGVGYLELTGYHRRVRF